MYVFILLYGRVYTFIWYILDFFRFMCYGTSTRCSAKIQIFFLDKDSETC